MHKFTFGELHLSEILGDIVGIRFCEDARRFPCEIVASKNIGSSDDDNLTYLLSDEQLLQLSDDRIATISSCILLHRLYRLMPDKLSEEQRTTLKDYYTETRFEMDNTDVQIFLDKLQSCNPIVYDHRHKKTKEFILDNGGHLRDSDCLDIIKSLTVDDYCENMYSGNSRFFGDDLIVFRPYADWIASDGRVFTDICIYIKLDMDLTDGTTVAIISFHDAKYED